MSANHFDVFSMRDALVGDYASFARSFTRIASDHVREKLDAIYADGRFWPAPLVQLSPRFRAARSVDQLVADGDLEPACATIFAREGAPITLYQHQLDALELAKSPSSYVVTTGTGSGKSLCFFVPIVNAILSAKRDERETTGAVTPRTRAIIIYPMNALANSQLEEIGKFVSNSSDITVARFTGDEDHDDRERIRNNPPDILLTNFMMLELLMTRQDELDRKVIANCEGLRFIVLDELHTYRGRQGADVAMLMRRVRERLKPHNLVCIGTSATMATGGTQAQRNEIVAGVASRLFGVAIRQSSVVVESLVRATDPFMTLATVRPLLPAALATPLNDGLSDDQLRKHPLAVWTELTLGLDTFEENGVIKLMRARPRPLAEAADELSKQSGVAIETCRAQLQRLLQVASTPERDRPGRPGDNERPFFAFKLHQFLSGAGTAYATLEPDPQRTVTVDGQLFDPSAPHKRLYPLHFCRECGQDYYVVRRDTLGLEATWHARNIDDTSADDEDDDNPKDSADKSLTGFLALMPTLDDRIDDDRAYRGPDDTDHIPEMWLEEQKGKTRVRADYRKVLPVERRVAVDGTDGQGTRVWFVPGRFRFCVRCGATHSGASRDRTRLASLSAEGRSSATTVIVSSALRYMNEPGNHVDAATRKLLGFTDNRQDAALQAGHFNDFVFTSLLRAAMLRALAAAPSGIPLGQIGERLFAALGFDSTDEAVRAEWLQEPGLRGLARQNADALMRAVLAWRAVYDQRRGWRFANPNLEGLGLLSVSYAWLDEMVRDESAFTNAHEVIKSSSFEVRKNVFVKLFDFMRQGLAIAGNTLDRARLEQLQSASIQTLREPWAFDRYRLPPSARWLVLDAPARRHLRPGEEDPILRGNARSAFGRELGRPSTWGLAAGSRLKRDEIDAVIASLLEVARVHGLVIRQVSPLHQGSFGWQLSEEVLHFAPGTAGPTPNDKLPNPFFTGLYTQLAEQLRDHNRTPFELEAREHTAQVDGKLRLWRENRFRFGVKEQSWLRDPANREGLTLTENETRLPALFCSPTMELGVDISQLNTVYLRNVPPTPSNYAQRSGRAGRSGQAALVVTYCSSQGPHDQYFFARQPDMVHGAVKAPTIDLANRDLIESHLCAVWLAATGVPLPRSIAELVDLEPHDRPVRTDVRDKLTQPVIAPEARRRILDVLALVDDELTPVNAPWFESAEALADSLVDIGENGAYARFDRALTRWRDLYSAAHEQLVAAQNITRDHSASRRDADNALGRERQARQQLDLLKHEQKGGASDFYLYRYLATEGFLPGYNFPRLPVMAWIPGRQQGAGSYLQRPRFLALSEFGPRSIVYHEGRTFRVVRVQLRPSDRAIGANAALTTSALLLCSECGAATINQTQSVCDNCSRPLGGGERIDQILRIENVGTKEEDRITANDEERERQGFDLQTTFTWARRDGVADRRALKLALGQSEVATLNYGAGATITRLNKGLRRRKDQGTLGFFIDPASGLWAGETERPKSPQGEGRRDDVDKAPRQRVVPMVSDTRNALILQSPQLGIGDDATIVHATVQNALLRGLELEFQLEPGELLVEPLPRRDDRRTILFYEATEGGAGALSQLVTSPHRLANAVRHALDVMHYDVTPQRAESEGSALPDDVGTLTTRPDTQCVKACYKCLMSYYNQPDHENLDRTSAAALRLLLDLARAAEAFAPTPPSAPNTEGASPAVHAQPAATNPPIGDPGGSSRLDAASLAALAPGATAPYTRGDVSFTVLWPDRSLGAQIGGLSDAQCDLAEALGLDVVCLDPDDPDLDARLAELKTRLSR